MRRRLLAGLLAAAVLGSGCGETTNRWDGIALDRFETDPIFELVPIGATQLYDALSIGSPESRDFGSDNARALAWHQATEPADAIAREYVEALLKQGWSELDVECTGDGTGKAVYIVNARRSVDDYVDIVRVVSSDKGPERDVGVVVSTPFHASPQPATPDPSMPPDTACLDAIQA